MSLLIKIFSFVCLFIYIIRSVFSQEEDVKDCWVLSIDGGGYRSIISTVILHEIEERLGLKTSEIFHVTGGTSGGAFVCTLLNLPSENQNEDGTVSPKYTAKHITDIMFEEKHRFLPQRDGLFSKLWHSFYQVESLEDLFKQYYKDHTLDQLVRHTVAFATDIYGRTLKTFESWNTNEKYLVREVNLASSAIPFALKARSLRPINAPDHVGHTTYYDGGLLLNDPSAELVAAAKKLYPKARIHVVSLGSGICKEPFPSILFKLITNPFRLCHNVFYNVPSYFIQTFLFKRQLDVNQHYIERLHTGMYWRFDPLLRFENLGFHNGSHSHLEYLAHQARNLLNNNPDFEKLIAAIKESKGLAENPPK